MSRALALALAVLAVLTGPAAASPPEVVAVSATPGPSGWRFDVTIRHDDTGWEHYADGWEVIAPDGTSLGTRDLLHPHETEQPFTRSLAGVAIPAGIARVGIRARDNVTGWAEAVFFLDLPR